MTLSESSRATGKNHPGTWVQPAAGNHDSDGSPDHRIGCLHNHQRLASVELGIPDHCPK